MNSVVVLIRGANDIGSAVAHRLFTEGYRTVLHEQSQPTTARRKMSFVDAVFDGRATLENITAELARDNSHLQKVLAERHVIPISVAEFSELIEILHPQVLVDARMRKHEQPEIQRGLAPLAIGLGPNFIAGETVDAAIETGWGESLGRVIWRGMTNPLLGEPREIEGHARDRYVYAPVAGVFHSTHQIGEQVEKDEILAQIDTTALLAPIAGTLRGLTRAGVIVSVKTKVIEIDPRKTGAKVDEISERPAQIAQGVLEAIQKKFT